MSHEHMKAKIACSLCIPFSSFRFPFSSFCFSLFVLFLLFLLSFFQFVLFSSLLFSLFLLFFPLFLLFFPFLPFPFPSFSLSLLFPFLPVSFSSCSFFFPFSFFFSLSFLLPFLPFPFPSFSLSLLFLFFSGQMRKCFVMQCCVVGRMYEVESGTCPYGRHGRHCSGLFFFFKKKKKVETHKVPIHLHPFWFGVWFEGFSRLARNNQTGAVFSAMVVLVRNNKARPYTAQGTRRLSRPMRTRMHTQTNSHSQHQHALPTPTRAPTPTRTNTRSPTHTHTKTHANAQPRTTKQTLNRHSRCWDHGNSDDRGSPVYQDWNEVSRMANDRITSSNLETFLARQRPVLQFQLFE